MTTEQTSSTNQASNGKRPDWIVKSPSQRAREPRLERVGAAWNRDDGGICIRLIGKQVVDSDIYLYPNISSDLAGS